MRAAAASHVALSGLLERPLSLSSASAVLSDLEHHLSDAGRKQARWRDELGATSQRLSGAPAPPPSQEAVHVSLLRRELHSLEEKAQRAGTPQRQRQAEELRQRVAGLEQELAAGTHACWRAKEDLGASQRALHAKSVALERVETEMVKEKGRAAALLKQLSEAQGERDAATRRLSVEASQREEAEVRLRRSEFNEEALAAARDEERARLRAIQHAKAEAAAAAATAAAAAGADEAARRRQLEERINELELALLAEASERGTTEQRGVERLAAVSVKLQVRLGQWVGSRLGGWVVRQLGGSWDSGMGVGWEGGLGVGWEGGL